MSKKLPKRKSDFSGWYNELVRRADLAENSDVRGCMVIKPYGFAIWEKMRDTLDTMFKNTGHSNAYFPLFIPKSYLSREASHVEGFAKECAVVTHYRLKNAPDGQSVVVDPESKLEEELIVRPTSETVIWSTYRKWIQSYRDLPLLVNQWANVVRWEMRTRIFLRTAEFLWQEGHTAHATSTEAIEETQKMLDVYADFAQNHMAMPVIKGVKTETERFAGALDTYCIEALMQDGKALQAGTSHYLGQNFAKAFDVKYNTADGNLEYVWGSSWGVSTRLMGALIMTHSDDQGLVLPPKLAPIQVVVVPIPRGETQMDRLLPSAQTIADQLRNQGLSVKLDDDEQQNPGWKFAEYELKGVPVRLVIGPRDLENQTVEVARRDTGEKQTIPMAQVTEHVLALMTTIQQNLFDKALTYQQENTRQANDFNEFKKLINTYGGFIEAHWDGTAQTEAKIKEMTKATIRAIPFNENPEPGQCVLTGQPSKQRVLFARSY